MDFKGEVLNLFPTVDIVSYGSLYPYICNNRKYNVLSVYKILIRSKKEFQRLWIYITKTKYIISYGFSLQKTIFNKKEKYKLFQIIASHERLSTN